MELIGENGAFLLPEDFSFEIERNSAFFSEEGSSSLSVTIPATPSEQAKLGQPMRLARRNKFINLAPVILSKGVFRKKGTLVINSASKEGISCAVALEDSDFYTNWKEKNLKELFARKVLTDCSTPEAWYEWLYEVYTLLRESDFRITPVAVNRKEDDGAEYYQVNNEPQTNSEHPGQVEPITSTSQPGSTSGGSTTRRERYGYQSSTPTSSEEEEDTSILSLEHQARMLEEDGDIISVPEGYGMAPFLKLYRFWEILFELCGYTVEHNVFRTDARLAELILLHNCSDVICNGKIDYSDLVPGKTVSEILEWMLHKFHAQIVVYPGVKKVDIILLEDILSAGFDMDLTHKLLNHLTYEYSETSRVVVVPDTSLEGAKPAADDMESLVKANIAMEILPEADVPGHLYPTLIYRKALGDFWQNRYVKKKQTTVHPTEEYALKRIGSDLFTYDRRNSRASEEITWEDPTPPMVFVNGILMPYIGDRKHRNTTYNGSEKDEDQDILIAFYGGLSAQAQRYGGRYYYATTQKYDNAGVLRHEGAFSLTPEEMVPLFFRIYNKMLLNGMISVTGEFDLSVEELMNFNLYALKLHGGQKFLPAYMRYEVGRRIRCLEMKMYLSKDYDDGADDEPFDTSTIPQPQFTWQLNTSVLQAKLAELQAVYPAIPGYHTGCRTEIRMRYAEEDEDTFYLSAPTALGQKSGDIYRTVEFYHIIWTGNAQDNGDRVVETWTLPEWFDSVAISS